MHESGQASSSSSSSSVSVLTPPPAKINPSTSPFGFLCVCKLSSLGGGPFVRRVRLYPRLALRKVLSAFLLFVVCWYEMHFAGGAVATMRFQRVSTNESSVYILPDVVMDFFKDTDADEKYCLIADNLGADLALGINYILLFLELFFGRNGHILFQRVLHVSAMVFVIRSTVVGMTGLPNPNDRCIELQTQKMTYLQAVTWLMSQFPPRSCGDLIFSGHTALLTSWLLCFEKHNGFFRNNRLLRYTVWLFCAYSILMLVVCRAHYSVDVVLGLWMAFFIVEFYHSRACDQNVHKNSFFAKLIRRQEDWGRDWEDALENDSAPRDGRHVSLVKQKKNSERLVLTTVVENESAF